MHLIYTLPRHRTAPPVPERTCATTDTIFWRLGATPGAWESYEAEAPCLRSSFVENQIKDQIVSKPRKPVHKDSGERKDSYY